ncbi:hypothetical protein BEN47_08195 [Hymenobacter lapidarius]|uniref:Universal stress protein B n=1 Tax=Hymenobacter lapidarius TaxID=1908237 RepID=A0A1G1TDZ1_9BACT|nr:hypothetical protein [Hymenobacter lapidarius]OGX89096.1 hypothetical protein BEN47_08195 [Hymenobacter lapidarius]
MPFLEILSLGLFFFVFLHVPAFVFYNRTRIQQMLYYINLCRGRELKEIDYLDLLDEYTSFLGYASFSPNRKYYPSLYTNAAFAAFAHRSKRIMQYFALVLVVGVLSMMLLDLVQK